MLYLTRKIGEAIMINEDVEITVVSVNGKTVKLGFTFPPDARVLRKEVFERIQAENRAAAESAASLGPFTLPSSSGAVGQNMPKKEADPPPPPPKDKPE